MSRVARTLDNAAIRDLRARCAEVCAKHHMALVRRAYTKLRSLSRAHDAVQEAYLRVCSLTDSPPIVSMRAYLNKIVDNVALDWMRAEHVRVRDKHFVQQVVEHRANPTPEDMVLEEEFRTRVAVAINCLPPKCKLAYTLVELEERPAREVAEAVGAKEMAIRQLVHRAYGHLVHSLNG